MNALRPECTSEKRVPPNKSLWWSAMLYAPMTVSAGSGDSEVTMRGEAVIAAVLWAVLILLTEKSLFSKRVKSLPTRSSLLRKSLKSAASMKSITGAIGLLDRAKELSDTAGLKSTTMRQIVVSAQDLGLRRMEYMEGFLRMGMRCWTDLGYYERIGLMESR